MKTDESIYTAHDGRKFRFDDHVCIEMLLGVPDEERTGRLVQVRKGCGQFRSDIYFLRLRNGSLRTFENALMRHVGDVAFENAFYRSNGQTPPVIPEQGPSTEDSPSETYTIEGQWPETGFIITKPAQPQRPGAFSMVITTKA